MGALECGERGHVLAGVLDIRGEDDSAVQCGGTDAGDGGDTVIAGSTDHRRCRRGRRLERRRRKVPAEELAALRECLGMRGDGRDVLDMDPHCADELVAHRETNLVARGQEIAMSRQRLGTLDDGTGLRVFHGDESTIDLAGDEALHDLEDRSARYQLGIIPVVLECRLLGERACGAEMGNAQSRATAGHPRRRRGRGTAAKRRKSRGATVAVRCAEAKRASVRA